MRFSYTEARKKTAFSSKMQTMFIVFDIVVLVLFAVYMFFLFQDYTISKQIRLTNIHITKSKTDIKKIDKEIKQIRKDFLFYEKIETKNTVLQDSIKNLFDLVPPQVVLLEAVFLDDALVLRGIASDKYIYESMLQTPLKSIYGKNKSSIKVLENKEFEFVSKSYMGETR